MAEENERGERVALFEGLASFIQTGDSLQSDAAQHDLRSTIRIGRRSHVLQRCWHGRSPCHAGHQIINNERFNARKEGTLECDERAQTRLGCDLRRFQLVEDPEFRIRPRIAIPMQEDRDKLGIYRSTHLHC